MMSRVGLSLVYHEFLERTRDRWVAVASVLFGLLACGTTIYGRSSGAAADALTGPSLVTLASLLVPLVGSVLGHDAIVGERERNTLGLLLSLPITRGEVVVAKFLGRLCALGVATLTGLCAAALLGGTSQLPMLIALVWPTLLLGAAFLALGILVSSLTSRQVTAASIIVALWFVFVFFYDLGLLGLVVVTDGAISQSTVAQMVYANPSGLFRVQMMAHFAGPDVLEGLGMTVGLPSTTASNLIWLAWILLPIGASAWVLNKTKGFR
jgi:Cu-processing system permease protein